MTDSELLAAALQGHDDWDKLYEFCRDRAQAEALARVLERHATAGSQEATAWATLLGEMHPGLVVKLPAQPLGHRPLRVLCAEDHPDVRRVINKSLTDAGFHVVAVSDGLAAWRHLSASIGDTDILVTDHQMPGMSGLELVRRARAAGFAGPIVVQTGSLTAETRASFNALNVDQIVVKSTRPEVIVDLVRQAGRPPFGRKA